MASHLDRQRPTGPGPPAVTDRRPVPRGVLPRGVQTWVMAGVAVGMLAIMLIVGRPDPPPRPAPGCRTRAGAECRPRPRLSGPPASARGAGTPRSADGNASAPSGADAVRRHGAGPSAGSDRRQSGSVVSTRASLPATSCSAGVPKANDRIRDGSARWPPALPRSQAHQVRRSRKSPTRWCEPPPGPLVRLEAARQQLRLRRHRQRASHGRWIRRSGAHRTTHRRSAQPGRSIACSKEPSSTPF